MKALPNKFYTMPTIANTTMDKKDLKELLLKTEGWIMANGQRYLITSEDIGADVYRVRLTKDVT